MTKWIAKIAKKNRALARIVEFAFYWAILSFLQYIWNALTTWDYTDYKVALWMFISSFVAWVVSGLQTYFRDKQSKAMDTSNWTSKNEAI